MRKITLIFAILLAMALSNIAQAQIIKTIPNLAAGGLKAALTAEELTTITKLIVSGTVDARDFRTMSKDMTALAIIDLSGTTVSQYDGALDYSWITFYAANEIPPYAFSDAGLHLRQFVYPASVTAIGHDAFRQSGLVGELIIPSTVTKIGDFAFTYLSGLSGNLVLPPVVEYIGQAAFDECTGLTGELLFPPSVSFIGEGAFGNCSGFTGVLTIPSLLTKIERSTFHNCNRLTGALTIPTGITSIGEGAFKLCSGFSGNTSIPASVSNIDKLAFLGCGGIFEVAVANPNYLSSNGVLYDKSISRLIQYPLSKTGDFVIPATVTTIDLGAFYNCKGLAGNVTIPASVNLIGESAFNNCINLKTITTFASIPINLTASDDVFTGVNSSSCILYVPAGTRDSYKAANQWGDFVNTVEMATTDLSVQEAGVSISIFPNPTFDSFKIKGVDSGALATITDVNGNQLLAKDVRVDETVSLNTLPSGVYIVRITCGNSVAETKIVKR